MMLSLFRQHRSLVKELRRYVEANPTDSEFTFEHLLVELQPANPDALAEALVTLVEEGTLEQVFRVESPTSHGGIADFASASDLPDRLYDPTVDHEIEVTPRDLRVVFHGVTSR